MIELGTCHELATRRFASGLLNEEEAGICREMIFLILEDQSDELSELKLEITKQLQVSQRAKEWVDGESE